MSDDESKWRRERIERLFGELKHEIERGVINREIGEHLDFSFSIPFSLEGSNFAVMFSARMKPVPRWEAGVHQPRLRLVKSGETL